MAGPTQIEVSRPKWLRPLFESKHSILASGSGVSCSICFDGQKGKLGSQEVLRWLGTDCRAGVIPIFGARLFGDGAKIHKVPEHIRVWVKGAIVHAAHDLGVYRGVFFCLKCGGVAAYRALSLVGPCTLARVQGVKNLRRLRAGELPHGTPAWPDGLVSSAAGVAY